MFTEMIQPCKKENSEDGINQRSDQQVDAEKFRILGKEQASHQRPESLMNVKKNEHQDEAADVMLGIQSRANRRSDVADESFRYSVQPDGVRQTDSILQQPNSSSQQQPRNGIAPAQAKIHNYQQRKFENLKFQTESVQKRLQDQRQKTHDQNRAVVKLMNLDVLGLRIHARADHRNVALIAKF